jgi:hypothetical protein
MPSPVATHPEYLILAVAGSTGASAFRLSTARNRVQTTAADSIMVPKSQSYALALLNGTALDPSLANAGSW